MLHLGGKNAKKKTSSSDSKRHFTVVMGNKEHGLYVSSSPSSAARKAVSKLCATDKKKKVQFSIREITQGSKKKTYGPYLGEIEKLAKPIELKGRVIRYKPVAKLNRKNGGATNLKNRFPYTKLPIIGNNNNNNNNDKHWFHGRDMEIGKIYRLKRKNSTGDLGLHRVMNKDDEKITFATFNITSHSNTRGKIMTVKISDDSISGYLDTTGTWFHGKKRISLRDMVLGTIYELRPKHSTSSLDLYKVIEKDDGKDKIKLAKLKTPAHPNFGANRLRPKIMTLKISESSIYGYSDYDLKTPENTSVFSENESNESNESKEFRENEDN
jgi:hypothetical protein